jgi:hypothetical protein
MQPAGRGCLGGVAAVFIRLLGRGAAVCVSLGRADAAGGTGGSPGRDMCLRHGLGGKASGVRPGRNGDRAAESPGRLRRRILRSPSDLLRNIGLAGTRGERLTAPPEFRGGRSGREGKPPGGGRRDLKGRE